MLGWKKKASRPSKDNLEAVSDALKEIESFFELNGFSRSRSAHVEPSSVGTDEEESNGDEEFDDEGSERAADFDREDLEISVGVFISELVKAEAIEKPKPRRAPTMRQIFVKLFGKKNKIIKMVEAFEEHTEGYFDAIVYDEMSAAFEALLEIRAAISDELSKYAQE